MPSYYLNRTPRPDGAHTVHAQGCPQLTLYRIHLGEFAQASEARRIALRHCSQAEVCARCAGETPRR